MRLITAGAIAGAMILGAVTVGAQASVKFSGMKLVDMHAHTPEQTVNVLVDASGSCMWTLRPSMMRAKQFCMSRFYY